MRALAKSDRTYSIHFGSTAAAPRARAADAARHARGASAARPQVGFGTAKRPRRGLLWAVALIVASLSTAFAAGWHIPLAANWNQLDVIWRDTTVRQYTGYGLLATLALVFQSGWQRRQRREAKRRNALTVTWHAALAVATIAAYVVHTGARSGDGLNAWLSTTLLAALICGSVAGISWANSSASPMARRLAPALRAIHWIALFPLPVLLAFHVLKTYYF